MQILKTIGKRIKKLSQEEADWIVQLLEMVNREIDYKFKLKNKQKQELKK